MRPRVCERCAERDAVVQSYAVRVASVGMLARRTARGLWVCEPCRVELDGADDDDTWPPPPPKGCGTRETGRCPPLRVSFLGCFVICDGWRYPDFRGTGAHLADAQRAVGRVLAAAEGRPELAAELAGTFRCRLAARPGHVNGPSCRVA